MSLSLRTVTPAAALPVSIDTLRAHLRVDSLVDDDVIAIYGQAATEWVESICGRALISQTICATLAPDNPQTVTPMVWGPGPILPLWSLPLLPSRYLELPRAPLQSVSDVRYVPRDGTEVTLTSGTDYLVSTAAEPGRVMLATSLPPSMQRFSITYVAGYGSEPAAVPAAIRNAILLLTAFLYEQRGDAGGEMPRAAEMLLAPFRLVSFGRSYGVS
ncbi:phage head-tail connector protein [Roseicella sp. DB1501]|uniref:head-tail connector protein n=1 Tax=Roseicella sp. DB1501 TaxID=2730925 RepID=UPI0014924853|nr:phage head-tail connector protein [Roseicella sp. DB1501]NOG69806.1 hypothetical protein [Roseicella sp. DB1501]